MSKVVIVLVCAVVLTVAGFFVGGMMTHVPPPSPAPVSTGDPARDLFNASKGFSQGADVMARRQTNTMIGAGVGLVVGVLAGIGLSAAVGKPKAAR